MPRGVRRVPARGGQPGARRWRSSAWTPATASRADAQRFLRSFPQSYPSYYDPSGQLGTAITDSSFTPVTVFYDRAGGRYIRQGPYLSVAKLERDVRRYALGA